MELDIADVTKDLVASKSELKDFESKRNSSMASQKKMNEEHSWIEAD